jgi:hypothetical protein
VSKRTERYKPRQYKLVTGHVPIRRTYVLDRNEVKDHQSGKTVEPKRVLDGDLDILK